MEEEVTRTEFNSTGAAFRMSIAGDRFVVQNTKCHGLVRKQKPDRNIICLAKLFRVA